MITPRRLTLEILKLAVVSTVFCHALSLFAGFSPQLKIAVMAGAKEHEVADGQGPESGFSSPYALTVDAAGNVFVVDSVSQTIRKITPGGSVSTIAGVIGEHGSDDGACSGATFSSPQGIAVDKHGNIFVADTNNQVIRKISSSGVVSTFAGSAGEVGFIDGAGKAARFDLPSAIVVDDEGTLYVADSNNQVIRKISNVGVVSTLAGDVGVHGAADGRGSAAQFSNPQGLAIDRAGNLYVADTNNQLIRKISPAGEVVTVAGTADLVGASDGTGNAAHFNYPFGIAVDKWGEIYVADVWNNTVRKIKTDGQVLTVAGLAKSSGLVDGDGKAARFFGPRAVAIDDQGALYIADTGNGVIRKAVPSGAVANADFNQDGATDIVWQNPNTGERVIWLMNGTGVVGGVGLDSVPREWEISATGDVNADGNTDLIWTNTSTGERTVWLMDGADVVSGVGLGTIPVEWVIASTGDFNGDGKSDLVWQNTQTGERSIWLMNGASVISGVGLGVVSTEWWIAGAGDFNGDGQTDIYWQNTVTGQHLVWYMNGTNVSSGVGLGAYPQFSIAGLGDYNGDGKPDLIMTNNATGERQIWLLNGTSVTDMVPLTTLSLDWVLNRPIPRRTQTDFNRDGKTDIVWQNSLTGERIVWLMNGTSVATGVSLGTIPFDWMIVATGDFNNDGSADLVWQNNRTGERTIWLMNGTTVSMGAGLDAAPLDWTISGSGDFNGDGKADLLLQNSTTNEAVVWLMDGTNKVSTVSLGIQASLRIATVGDFNNDGKTDIVWRNPVTEKHTIWLMNGAAKSSEVSLGTFGPEWAIAGSGDFNQDGKSDLLWQNSVTGERLLWLMNGTTVGIGVGLGTFPAEWSFRS